jgi:hypothetical protein
MPTLLLAVFIICGSLSAWAAPRPTPEEALRQKLGKLPPLRLQVEAAGGPDLAAVLQNSLRAAEGGETINVVWQGPSPGTFRDGPVKLDLRELDAYSLLSLACRQARVFWGLRHGTVVLDATPVPTQLNFLVEPVLVGKIELPRNRDPQADLELTATIRSLLPAGIVGNEEPFAARYEPAITQIFITTLEEHVPLIRRLMPSFNIQPRSVHITATWVAYPAERLEQALAASKGAALEQADLLSLLRAGEKRMAHQEFVWA